MQNAKSTYRRRQQILGRIKELSYRRNSLNRRINPGHSSAFIPGPASFASDTLRDAPGAIEELREVDSEMTALVKEAVELGGRGQRWIDRINCAADLCLVRLEEADWSDDGRGNYRASDWTVVYCFQS